MREAAIEQYLRRACAAQGVQCYKWVSPSCVGVPDRILIFPFGLVAFVELKAPGKRPTPLQVAVREKMEKNNAHVSWADSKDMVDSLLNIWSKLDQQAEGYSPTLGEDIF